MVLGIALAAPAATQAPSTAAPRTQPSSGVERAWVAPPPALHYAAPAAAGHPSVVSRRVCVTRANVRSGPGTAYRVVGTLGRGASVTGPVTKGWLKIRSGRWISTTVICAKASGSAPSGAAHPSGARPSSAQSFQAWARALDPAGNANWTIDYARTHTRGVVRGLTVFHSWGRSRSTVYIQPGMGWAKTKMVMAHEAIHVRQIRYDGFRQSLRVFGSVPGMERAADCGATLTLGYVVRSGCSPTLVPHVRNLLAGRAA